MSALGVRLRPSSSMDHKGSVQSRSKSRQWYFTKLALIAVVSALLPLVHEELRRRRGRDLERRERERRYQEFRRGRVNHRTHGFDGDDGDIDGIIDGGSSSSNLSVTERRARDRRTRLIDFVLGLCEMVLPPLRLAKHIAFLWGIGGTPSLAMHFAGWEYDDDHSGVTSMTSGRHRHANLQYAHRRLMAEEALRTAAAMTMMPVSSTPAALPSPPPIVANNGSGGDVNVTEANHNARGATTSSDGDDADVAGGRGNRNGVTPEREGRGSIFSFSSGLRRRPLWNKILSSVGLGARIADDAPEDDGRRRMKSQCVICRTTDPPVPYAASPCECVYCYTCLRSAVTDDARYHCVECGQRVVSSGPV